MSQISPEEADRLADLLNQICSATMNALQEGNLQQCLGVAVSLRDLHSQFDAESEIAPFILLLARWLEGERPTDEAMKEMSPPFRRALKTMLRQVPSSGEQAEQAPQETSQESREPISRHVLTQLISAVVASRLSEEVEMQRQLAAQLVNLQAKLDDEGRGRLGPLLENLRAILGGVDPQTLPSVPDPGYQRLWAGVCELLSQTGMTEEMAHEQLLDRLVHNTQFVLRAQNPELTESFTSSLLSVQREALETERPAIATLISAIRARLQGVETESFVASLEGKELEAWQKIEAETEQNQS